MTRGLLRELVEGLWSTGCRGAFSDEQLLMRLLEDGGNDTEDLTLQTITSLLDEKSPESWSVVNFASSEAVSFYLVTAHKMSFQQVIAAAFSACVLADASRAHEGDWGMEHDKIMALCAILAGRLELEHFLPVMSYIFGKGGQSPMG